MALDLISLDPSFRDTSPVEPLPQRFYDIVSGKQAFQTVATNKIPEFADTMHTLAKWTGKADIATYVIQAMSEVNFRLTNACVHETHRFAVPQAFKDLNPNAVIAAAIFFDEESGPVLSLPIWSRLPRLSRQALLIHEGFRRMQIRWGLEFSDEKLQKLVATLLLATPGSVNLDTEHFQDGDLLKFIRIQKRERSPKEASSRYMDKACKMMTTAVSSIQQRCRGLPAKKRDVCQAAYDFSKPLFLQGFLHRLEDLERKNPFKYPLSNEEKIPYSNLDPLQKRICAGDTTAWGDPRARQTLLACMHKETSLKTTQLTALASLCFEVHELLFAIDQQTRPSIDDVLDNYERQSKMEVAKFKDAGQDFERRTQNLLRTTPLKDQRLEFRAAANNAQARLEADFARGVLPNCVDPFRAL